MTYAAEYPMGDAPERGAEPFKDHAPLPSQFATQREFWQRVAAVEYAQLIERLKGAPK